MTSSLEAEVGRAMRADIGVEPGQAVVMAVSGGADSTALVVALERLVAAGRLQLALRAAHMDHGMRDGSERDADRVSDLCRELGVALTRARRPVAPGADLERRAREERYAFLEEVAAAHGRALICVAHNRDDQAETVLHRLARGAGVAGLSAMAPLRDGRIARPLLKVPRSDIEAYLRDRGIGWVEDPSNTDPQFTRNRIRHRVLPVLERELGVDVGQRLATLAEDLRAEARLASREVDRTLADVERVFPLARLEEVGDVAGRYLHRWLERAAVRASRTQILAVRDLAQGRATTGSVDLGGGWRVYREYDVLRLDEGLPKDLEPTALAVPGRVVGDGWEIEALRAGDENGRYARQGRLDLDCSAAAQPLWVRPVWPGARVRLRGGTRKVSDVFVDAKIPRQRRRTWPLVTDARDRVLWIPGMRSAVDDAVMPPGKGPEILLWRKQGLPEIGANAKKSRFSGENQ